MTSIEDLERTVKKRNHSEVFLGIHLQLKIYDLQVCASCATKLFP